MIIIFYESNYPVIQAEEPKWEELPSGFFQVDQRQVTSSLTTKSKGKVLHGTFIYAHGERPEQGKHLLAAFSHQGDRYLFNTTLSYLSSEAKIMHKQKWPARLGLSKFIKKW